MTRFPDSDKSVLWLYGRSGAGKTDIARRIGTSFPKTGYFDCHRLLEHYTDSCLSGNLFVLPFDSHDLLIIDNFDICLGKKRTQEAFFSLFQRALNTGKKIILVSINHPSRFKYIRWLDSDIHYKKVAVKVSQKQRILEEWAISKSYLITPLVKECICKKSDNLFILRGEFNKLIFRRNWEVCSNGANSL